MQILQLHKGFGDHSDFKLFKFPGGEIHFKSKVDLRDAVALDVRLNSSDDILALCIVVDTVRKAQVGHTRGHLEVAIPYFPYQQADIDSGEGECFSLKTIVNILNSLDVDEYNVFDPHSTVTPALLKNCEVLDNSWFVGHIISDLYPNGGRNDKVVLLSPDAGAYKKIFKLAEKIEFKGEILCCQKNRDITNGNVQVVVPPLPKGKDVLIIDDICVGGRTFIEIAKHRTEETGKWYLAVSHGIFSSGFTELYQHFNQVFTTNSRADSYPTESFGKVPQTFLKQFKII